MIHSRQSEITSGSAVTGAVAGSVCIVPLTLSVSGTERVAHDIVEGLVLKGRAASALIPSYEALDLYAETLSFLTPSVFRIGTVIGVRSPFPNLYRAWRLFRQLRPICVHFHCPGFRWGLEVIAAAYLARVPLIIRTEHNPLNCKPSRIFGPQLTATDKMIRQFTYVSEGNMGSFEQYLPQRRGRGMVIANGIDETRFAPSKDVRLRKALRTEFNFPDDSRIAVFVGGYGGRRPLSPIFEAFKNLLESPRTSPVAQNWRILIVGTGDGDSMMLPQKLGISQYVRFAGKRENIEKILPSCDLYVSASHFEGLSIAMLEAWACGLPVLSTDVHGISDVLGYEIGRQQVVPIGDIPKFAEAWYEFMIASSGRVDGQRDACRAVRTEFTNSNMLAKYLDLYS